MAYIPRSSFTPGGIPGAVPQQIQKTKTVNIVSLFANVIFAVALIGVAGMYGYRQFVQNQLIQAQAVLHDASHESIKNVAEEIESFRLFDSKLQFAKSLLDNHLAVQKVFALLESMTKETVQYTDFKFSYDPGYKAEVSVSGVTDSFASVVLQKTAVKETAAVNGFELGDIATFDDSKTKSDKQGGTEAPKTRVTFSLMNNLNTPTLRYGNTEKAESKSGTKDTTLGETQTEPVATGTQQ